MLCRARGAAIHSSLPTPTARRFPPPLQTDPGGRPWALCVNPGSANAKEYGMKSPLALSAVALCGLLLAATTPAQDKQETRDSTPPPGFTALFNGKDLTGWQGL